MTVFSSQDPARFLMNTIDLVNSSLAPGWFVDYMNAIIVFVVFNYDCNVQICNLDIEIIPTNDN